MSMKSFHFISCIFQHASKFTICGKDEPMNWTGSYIQVPYLAGHHYVLVPSSTADGKFRISYSKTVPVGLAEAYPFWVELQHPPVC